MFEYLKLIVKNIYFKNKYRSCKILGDVPLYSAFEGRNVIGKRSVFAGKIGYGSYIGQDCIINAEIGRFCSIGSNVNVLLGTHPVSGFVSTHPAFFSLSEQNGETFVKTQKFDEQVYADTEKKTPIIIGNDVWIGGMVTILGGLKIGDGAVIGAGAVVTHDVKPYEVVAGCPARVIKKRFDDDTVEWLLNFKWWNKSVDWIRNNAEYFDNIDEFKKKYSDNA